MKIYKNSNNLCIFLVVKTGIYHCISYDKLVATATKENIHIFKNVDLTRNNYSHIKIFKEILKNT